MIIRKNYDGIPCRVCPFHKTERGALPVFVGSIECTVYCANFISEGKDSIECEKENKVKEAINEICESSE